MALPGSSGKGADPYCKSAWPLLHVQATYPLLWSGSSGYTGKDSNPRSQA